MEYDIKKEYKEFDVKRIYMEYYGEFIHSRYCYYKKTLSYFE